MIRTAAEGAAPPRPQVPVSSGVERGRADAAGAGHAPPARARKGGRRVLVLTYFYAPEPNFITEDVARVMARDAEVTVIAPHPNYPRGRFYPGTRWWLPRRTCEEGVTVWRVPMFPDHSNSTARRFISYVSFMLAAALLAPFVSGRPAVVWVYQTPFTTVLAGLWYRYLLRSRLVYTCADLWPESFSAAGVSQSPRILRWAFAYRRFVNRRADLIVCSTRGTLERFAAEGVPRDRLAFVPVWVDGIESLPGEGRDAAGVPTVVYAGNLGPAQQLESVVRGARVLLDRGVEVRVDLFGAGSQADALRALAEELGATNVRFPGRVPPEEAFRALSSAAGQVVCLRRSPLFEMTIPSKLCSAFAAGAPIVYALRGEPAEIVERTGAGFEFEPDVPDTFADAVERLLALRSVERAEMRGRLQRTYREEFAAGTLLRRYRELLLSSNSAA